YPGGGGNNQSQPSDLRLAVRNAPACPKLIALPPADPGAEAILYRPSLHCHLARRSDLGGFGPAPAKHCSRRDLIGATHSALWRESQTAAHSQVPGHGFSGRLPRLLPRAWGPASFPALGGDRAQAAL